MVTVISRTLKSGKTFTVEVTGAPGQRVAVAKVDGVEIGRGAGQVGWTLLKPSGAWTHAAGKVGGILVGMSAAEAKQVGKVVFAEEIAETVKARRFDGLHNEGGEGFNPHL